MEEFRGRVGSRQLLRNTPANQSQRSKKSRRSASEGGQPRTPSVGKQGRQASLGSSREVRCACQFYMCDSLLPDKINPVGTQLNVKSRVTSPVITRAASPIKNNLEPHQHVDTKTTEQPATKDTDKITRNATPTRKNSGLQLNIHREISDSFKRHLEHRHIDSELDHKATDQYITKDEGYLSRNATPSRRNSEVPQNIHGESKGTHHLEKNNDHKEKDQHDTKEDTNKNASPMRRNSELQPNIRGGGASSTKRHSVGAAFDHKGKDINRNASPTGRNLDLQQNRHGEGSHSMEQHQNLGTGANRNASPMGRNSESNHGEDSHLMKQHLGTEFDHIETNRFVSKDDVIAKRNASPVGRNSELQSNTHGEGSHLMNRQNVGTELDHKEIVAKENVNLSSNTNSLRRNSGLQSNMQEGSHLMKRQNLGTDLDHKEIVAKENVNLSSNTNSLRRNSGLHPNIQGESSHATNYHLEQKYNVHTDLDHKATDQYESKDDGHFPRNATPARKNSGIQQNFHSGSMNRHQQLQNVNLENVKGHSVTKDASLGRNKDINESVKNDSVIKDSSDIEIVNKPRESTLAKMFAKVSSPFKSKTTPAKIGDHEYEPINPPPDTPPTSHTSQADASDTQRSHDGFTGEKFLRIPMDNELVLPHSEEDLKHEPKHKTTSPKPSASSSEQHQTTSDAGISDPTTDVDQETTDKGPTMKQKMKTQADVIKTRIRAMKGPDFSKVRRPDFSKIKKPKFTVPKINRPKFARKSDRSQSPPTPPRRKYIPQIKTWIPPMPPMPKMPKIQWSSEKKEPKTSESSTPFSFSFPRAKRQMPDQRTFSTTESSVGSKPNIFDFRTYPRIFDKTKKSKQREAEEVTSSGTDNPTLEVATAPKRKKGPVGARWVKKFTDIDYADAELKVEAHITTVDSVGRAGSLERRMEADLRYQQALEAEDEMREYERETQDIHRQSDPNYPDRWSHGSFHHPQVDLNKKETPRQYEDTQQSERSSVGSSGSRRRRGVLEEIDSDEFFLRQKGISQDNIQYGLYLSSEIRDAFRQPINALSQLSDAPQSYGSREYEMDASDLSLTKPYRPKREKRKMKKTRKIKKTPHASHEKVEQELIDEEEPPNLPKRGIKSKPDSEERSDEPTETNKTTAKAPIARYESDNLSLPNIVGYIDRDINKEYERFLKDESKTYENEMMKDKEQPEIVVSNGREAKFEVPQKDIDTFLRENGMTDVPKPPTRRNRSLRSLDRSERDSLVDEFHRDAILQDIPLQEISVYRVQHEYVTPTLDRSPVAPKRLRSRSRTSEPDDDRTSRGAESFTSDLPDQNITDLPEQKVTDLRDEMGYAIVDKNRQRDKPPRPPTPRRSRSRSLKKNLNDTKFFTTPRPLNDAPPRPTRNYSTLGPSRPPRKKSPNAQKDDNKENINLGQYIEIEDDLEEHSRLQSGEVISKMKSRPLPAPPRPPRKTRDHSKEPLQDITFEDNIQEDIDRYEKDTDSIPPASETETVEEIEVSTQTDPLPDDFICEEVLQEPTDKIVAPTRRRRSTISETGSRTERPKTPLDRSVSPNVMIIERRIQTPTVDFDVDSTVTHASILVKPVAEYPPESYVSQRFSADLPDIMPDILSAPITYSDEERQPSEEPKEIELEKQIESIKDEPIHKSEEVEPIVLKDDSEYNKNVLQSTEDDIPLDLKDDSEYYKNMLESTEDDMLPPEEDEPPAIPEKPLRLRMKQASKEEMPQSPILPSPEAMPPYPPTYQPQIIERIIERPVPFAVTPGPETEVEILKAAKLQVTDLDVERLTVGELQAQKILVSEIDGVSLQISELSSKTGSITVNGLEIPTGLIQEILEKLQPISQPPTVVEQVSTQTETVEPEIKETGEQVSTQTEVSIKETPITEQVSTQTDTNTSEVVETQTEKITITEQAFTQTDDIEKECPATETITEIITLEPEIISEISLEPENIKNDEEIIGEQQNVNLELIKIDEHLKELIMEEVPIVKPESFIETIDESIVTVAEQSMTETPQLDTQKLSIDEKEIPIETIDDSVVEQQSKTETPQFDTHKITKLTTETIDISESPLTFDTAEDLSSQAKKKLELDLDTSNNDELVKDVIDELLSGQISDLQKRIATLQEQMTLESMLDSEDEIVPDEPLSEFDESLIPEIIDEISPHDSEVDENNKTEQLSLSVVKNILDDNDVGETKISAVPIEEVTQTFSPLEKIEENKEITNVELESEPKPSSSYQSSKPPKEKIHRTLSEPVTESEVPFANILGNLAQSHVLQGLHIPVAYNPEIIDEVTSKKVHIEEAELDENQKETSPKVLEQIKEKENLILDDGDTKEHTVIKLDDSPKENSPKETVQKDHLISDVRDIEEHNTTKLDESHKEASPKALEQIVDKDNMVSDRNIEDKATKLDESHKEASPKALEQTVQKDNLILDDQDIEEHKIIKLDENQKETSQKTIEKDSKSQEKPKQHKIFHVEPTPGCSTQEPLNFSQLPSQQFDSEHIIFAQNPIIQGLPFPVTYYPELVHTISYPENLSEEDIPVHHKRRRPQRRISRSSSEEELRTRPVRHTRTPDPTIPQLTSQLAKASAVSIKKAIAHLMKYISVNILGTSEGKQDLQVVLILILIVIAALILLGFGGSKTVHLHHWEYFNPPTDL